MLSILSTGILILLIYLLQTAVFPAALPLHVFPNLLIIITASKGFMKGENAGMIVGFICGLLYDIFLAVLLAFTRCFSSISVFSTESFPRCFIPRTLSCHWH